MSRARTEHRYEKLTWPEINDAVELGKVCIVPCGAVEQHGHHLPLDVDLVCPGGIAHGAGRALADKILVLPHLSYGYTGHVMDFPGRSIRITPRSSSRCSTWSARSLTTASRKSSC